MLKLADEWLFQFLLKKADDMPLRFIKLIAYYYTDARVRKVYWQRLGVFMGEGTFANLGFRVVQDKHVISVKIGSHVSIAPNVTLVCAESANNGCEINQISYVREHLTRNGTIVIEDEVWIGANVTILSGIRVGKCAVIGAGVIIVEK